MTVDRDDNRSKHQIRESISIRQHGKIVMNWDESSFDLPHTWNSVLPTIQLRGGGGEATRSRLLPAATDHPVAAQF